MIKAKKHHHLSRFVKMLRRLYSTFIEPSISMASTTTTADIGLAPHPGGRTFGLKRLESLDWMHTLSPCFPLNATQIELLYEPHQFYDKLVTLCTNAQQRISIASLYLGIGQLESNLVTTISHNAKQNQELKVNILLDYTRGTRGETNSKTILQSIVNQSQNILFSLYHTPNLRGLTKKIVPARWNELIGLQHMKLYIIDETVIISGANLSNDYFTNRQDRYIVINDKALSNFYHNLISTVQEFSLRVTATDINLHPNWTHLPYAGAKETFVSNAKELIHDFFQTVSEQQSNMLENSPEADTWIFPFVEMGQLGIHHDSIVTKRLFSSALPQSKLNLATGYFNLTDSYMDTLTNDCQAECHILMAHPTANGFLGAKGPAGSIPDAYSQIAKTFHQKLCQSGQTDRVKLYEFEKPNWTYHAKGLWYYLPDSTLPDVTLIGSSNFGERSVNRDLESQICLVTVNDKLRNQLQAECDNLYKFGHKAEQHLEVRTIPKWIRAVVAIFRNYF